MKNITNNDITKTKHKKQTAHNTTQFFFFLGFGLGHSTARIASSNTFFRPFCVRAEHSRYLTELISLAMARPWWKEIKDLYHIYVPTDDTTTCCVQICMILFKMRGNIASLLLLTRWLHRATNLNFLKSAWVLRPDYG